MIGVAGRMSRIKEEWDEVLCEQEKTTFKGGTL